MRKIISRLVSGLRLRLLLLVLLACAPLVGLTLHTASEERRQLVKEWKQRSQEMMELATQEEDQVIGQTRQLLFAVAESSQVRSGNRQGCEKLLAALFASHSRYANLGVIKTNGTFLASVRAPAGPANQIDLQLLDRALETRAFAIGSFPTENTNGKPIVNFGYPVLDSAGQVQAVVVAELDSDWFDRSGSKLLAHLPKGATWTEIDRNGKILVRYPSPETWIGQPFPEKSLMETVFSQNQGVVELAALDGRPDYYAFADRPSRLVPGDVVTLLGIPKQVLFARADRRRIEYLTGLAIAAGFAFMVGWVGSHFLVLRPVRTLVKSSARLATGDLSTRTGLSHWGDELGQLSGAFDQMAQALEHREAERQSADLALKASEMRYRRLFETARDGILILNADTGEIDDVNPFLTDMLGYTREQLLGNKLWEIGPFKDTKASKTELRNLQREAYVRYDDLRLETSAGKSINAEFVSNVYQVNGRKVIQCHIRDITKRKRAEEELRRNEVRLRGVVESTTDGLLVVDRNGRVLIQNRRFGEMWRIPSELLASSDDHALLTHVAGQLSDPEGFLTRAHALYSTDAEDMHDLHFKDGRVFERFSRPLVLQGAVMGRVWSFRDVTERKQNEARLQLQSTALEAAGSAIVITDRTGAISWANSAFTRLTGYAATEVLGANMRLLKSDQHDQAFYQNLWQTILDGRIWHAEIINRRKDGSLYTEDSTITALRDARGEITHFISVKEDITERKLAEEKLKTYSLKLQVLSRRLVEVQETERRNIARELHDEIGQSLTVMQLNLQAMLQSPGTGDQPRLNETLKVVERVLEQVQDISLDLRPSMLDDLGLESALRWYTDRQAALLELQVEFHADRLEQRLDPVIETECFRVAQEALTNVVRHAQAKAVTVDLRKEDGQIHLRVHDDGIGFAVAAVREKAVRGASLGLLSMEERAALAGGGLEFASTPGQGTEVHAWFPLRWQTPPSGAETS
jgi:PAS domain S-box-containing protein